MKRFIKMFVALALVALGTGVFAQSTTIRVRFANGKTGKPLKLKWYDIDTNKGVYKSYKVVKADEYSILVTFNDVSQFTFGNVGTHDYFRCDAPKQDAPQITYNLQDIIERGAVSPNYCGPAHAAAVPGELVIYNRHAHFWELTKGILQGLFVCA